MNVTQEKYYRMLVEDKPGVLSNVLTNLKEHSVDLKGLWGFGKGQGNGEIIVVPKDPNQLNQVATTLGMTLQEGNCFCLTDDNKTGALVDVLHKVTAAGINLHAVESIAVEGKFCCYMWCDESDTSQLSQILSS
ncbi:hypothetical protein OAO01_08050 [Oligoflexia bacterium]|nr:hypothetical protein [Oligoflexia bacterium]